jgi:hypothetical protein
MSETINDNLLEQLIRRMETGLRPCELTQDQVQLLKNTYGIDWFSILGFDENFFDRSVYDSHKQVNKKFSRIDNLLRNIDNGLEPSELTPGEVNLLIQKIGPDWFFKLGYKEEEHERSQYDNYVPYQEPIPPPPTETNLQKNIHKFEEWKKDHPPPTGGHKSWVDVVKYYPGE